jgi:formyl-CoA transferase
MKVLKGIKILDFTTFLAGPYMVRLLADLGASVIKVESEMPESYRMLAFAFATQNRNKRSLSIDLKKPAGKEIVTQLVRQADIIVENARPGVMKRLGLDYESCKKLKPDIIYISATGYGSSGPLAELQGLDPVVSALAGLMVSTCGPDNPPIYPRCNFTDVGVSALGAFGAALALLARKKSGQGQKVETSLLQSALALNTHYIIDYPGIEREYIDDIYPKGPSALCRLYCGTDGKWFFLNCTTEDDWQNLCKSTFQEFLLTDARFATPAARKKNNKALEAILAEQFSLTLADSWLAVLRQNNVPSAPALYEQEIYGNTHYAENGIFIEQEHPDLGGKACLVGFPGVFENMENMVTGRAPLLGEQTAEILAELGYADEQIAGLKKDKVVFG